MIEVRENLRGVAFRVRVQPRANRDEIAGEWQGALRVRLAAPPIDDRANDALRRLLAEHLGVPLGAVRIARGRHSRNKSVEVQGATARQIQTIAELSGDKAAKAGD